MKNFLGCLHKELHHLKLTFIFLACRPSDIPWLYYQENANTVLTDTAIETRFQFPDSMLHIFAAVFQLNGSFVGYRNVTGGLLQLCKNSDTFLNAAYVFGTTYEQHVSVFMHLCIPIFLIGSISF